ncbi:MAG: DUF3347 domain-containing protein [Mucilaginibacter sp.]|uniref:DUF3347 domain-containing protein n=1 Tax=Mucilaginibacter sp. TaxID=1882438 RepID=UPI0034E47BA7
MKTIKYLLLVLGIVAFHQTKAQAVNAVFSPVLHGYLSVEKALVDDDGKAANQQAAEMVKAVQQLNTDKLEPAQKAAWTNYSEKLRYNAQHISESTSIEHQREHFAALSDAVFSLLKKFKPDVTVYRQYCPMKKQYWINASAEIQNPYYGKKMQNCGKVTATIKGTAL